MKDKFLIIQTCVPDYRAKFYNYLTSKNGDIKVISGKEYYKESIKSVSYVNNVSWVTNHFFLNRKLLFQNFSFIRVLRAKTVIIEFNLRNVSFYPTIFLRLLFKRKIYLWGHAWSRSGKNSNSEFVRFMFKKMADGYIVYTEEQKHDVLKQLKGKEVHAACNAIYLKNEMNPKILPLDQVNSFIYVGRLVEDKKPMLLVKAFESIIKKLPFEVILYIVGDGPEFNVINNYLIQHSLKSRIKLLGHISDYNKLRELYSQSIASVSPGYVGLSITQSLGFGVPMIISKNEPHSPELEAADIGENAFYFETDSIGQLAEELVLFFQQKEIWYNKRKQISEICRDSYSIEKMAEPFLTVLN